MANNEMALIADSSLMAPVSSSSSAGVISERVEIGPIVIDQAYSAPQAISTSYPMVASYLTELTTDAGAERG